MAAGAGAGARTRRTPLSLKGRALALLAQREHSAGELRRKLLRHARAETARNAASATEGRPCAGASDEGDDATADDALARVDAVIDWLRGQRYLSDERFVESRVHARASRYGNVRIRQELAQHGVSLSPEAAQTLRDSELERATDVWRRKFGTLPADAAERARQSRFLAQRGFSAAVISRVMRNAGSQGDEEI
ncbi:regulatory protein RecX [Piscinibacter sp. XHJ-5]|uniref:regulatory protein RecX n=1 Tax=Piscinibacter sp. XHJ-5 TaxID=3037797 RepID=UPI002453229E|nr:regulatory protein RecX [Piscinibacter sp. XHJ-5]